MWAVPWFECLDDAIEYANPVTERRLTEQANQWIPGTIVAVQHPSPVRGELQGDPDGHRKRSSQMYASTVPSVFPGANTSLREVSKLRCRSHWLGGALDQGAPFLKCWTRSFDNEPSSIDLPTFQYTFVIKVKGFGTT